MSEQMSEAKVPSGIVMPNGRPAAEEPQMGFVMIPHDGRQIKCPMVATMAIDGSIIQAIAQLTTASVMQALEERQGRNKARSERKQK